MPQNYLINFITKSQLFLVKMKFLAILPLVFVFVADNRSFGAENKQEPTAFEIMNPGYTKSPDIKDNIDINSDSSVENILKKANYYYSMHNFDKAIELCKTSLEITSNKHLIAKINFSLSSNYLENGNIAYRKNKDVSLYKLSIECAKKCLDIIPYSWQALANIGSAYLNMRDYKLAAFYFSEAEKYIEKDNPNYPAITNYRAAAETLIKLNDTKL